MIVKEVVIINIPTTKFVTLEFGDRKLIAQKGTNHLTFINLCLFLPLVFTSSFIIPAPSLSHSLFCFCFWKMLYCRGRHGGLWNERDERHPTKNRPNYAFISQHGYKNKYYNETLDKFLEEYVTGDDDNNQLPPNWN